MSNTRLTVVVRKDLLLSPGLLAAQVSHAQNEFLRKGFREAMETGQTIGEAFNQEHLDWMEAPYISVLGVQTWEELNIIHNKAVSENLPTYVWNDTIPSPTFEGQFMEAKVAVSIGPADFDKIKLVTSGLELYP